MCVCVCVCLCVCVFVCVYMCICAVGTPHTHTHTHTLSLSLSLTHAHTHLSRHQPAHSLDRATRSLTKLSFLEHLDLSHTPCLSDSVCSAREGERLRWGQGEGRRERECAVCVAAAAGCAQTHASALCEDARDVCARACHRHAHASTHPSSHVLFHHTPVRHAPAHPRHLRSHTRTRVRWCRNC